MHHLLLLLSMSDHVALIYPPGTDLIAAFYGCLYAGLCPHSHAPFIIITHYEWPRRTDLPTRHWPHSSVLRLPLCRSVSTFTCTIYYYYYSLWVIIALIYPPGNDLIAAFYGCLYAGLCPHLHAPFIIITHYAFTVISEHIRFLLF